MINIGSYEQPLRVNDSDLAIKVGFNLFMARSVEEYQFEEPHLLKIRLARLTKYEFEFPVSVDIYVTMDNEILQDYDGDSLLFQSDSAIRPFKL